MKRMHRVFGDLDALRYVDGGLDDDRAAAYLAHLADEPAEMARVAMWSRQSESIRGAFAGVPDEPIPVSLRLANIAPPRTAGAADAIRATAAAPERPRAPPLAGGGSVAYLSAARAGPRQGGGTSRLPLAVALLVAAALAVVYLVHGMLPGRETDGSASAGLAAAPVTAVERAGDAFTSYALDPVHAVEFSAAQLQPLAHWATRRLGVTVPPPDLHLEGWTLLGGRMVPGNGGPALFYVYQEATGTRLSLFVARAEDYPPPAPALQTLTADGAALTFVSGPLVYVVGVDRSVDWLSRNAEALKGRIVRPATP